MFAKWGSSSTSSHKSVQHGAPLSQAASQQSIGENKADLLFDRHVRAMQTQTIASDRWEELWLECFTEFVAMKRSTPEPLSHVGFAPSSSRSLSLVHPELQAFFELFIVEEPPPPQGIFLDLYQRLLTLIRFCAGITSCETAAAKPKFGMTVRKASKERATSVPQLQGANDHEQEERFPQQTGSNALLLRSHSSGSSSGSGRSSGSGSTRAERREQFVAFYMQHDPTRTPDLPAHVDYLLNNFDMAEIVQSLQQKYGALPPGWGPRSVCDYGVVLPQIPGLTSGLASGFNGLSSTTTNGLSGATTNGLSGAANDGTLLSHFKPTRVGGGWALSFRERKQLQAMQKAERRERKVARQEEETEAAMAVQVKIV
jgi:hypothetical protein